MMMGSPFLRMLTTIAFWMCAIAGCAAQAPGGAATTADAFNQSLSSCSERTGYSPEDATNLAPNELGRNERAWAQCVYSGIEAHVAPKSAAPELYRRLVARHRELTDAIEAKTATRADRLREATSLLDQIRTAENAALAKREQEISQVQDVREQQRMMQDLERVHIGAVRAQQAIRVRIR